MHTKELYHSGQLNNGGGAIMLVKAFEVDNDGFLVDFYIVTIDENNKIVDEGKENFILVDMPNNLHKPKWNGETWVEGETESEKLEREVLQSLESLKPSPSEIADAELEIKMLTMLTELGVIQ